MGSIQSKKSGSDFIPVFVTVKYRSSSSGNLSILGSKVFNFELDNLQLSVNDFRRRVMAYLESFSEVSRMNSSNWYHTTLRQDNNYLLFSFDCPPKKTEEIRYAGDRILFIMETKPGNSVNQEKADICLSEMYQSFRNRNPDMMYVEFRDETGNKTILYSTVLLDIEKNNVIDKILGTVKYIRDRKFVKGMKNETNTFRINLFRKDRVLSLEYKVGDSRKYVLNFQFSKDYIMEGIKTLLWDFEIGTISRTFPDILDIGK